MNPFLESFKENRWIEGYFRYTSEDVLSPSRYYVTALNLSDPEAIALVEKTFDTVVNFKYVNAIDIRTTMAEAIDPSSVSQVIRFELSENHPAIPVTSGGII